MQQVLRLRGLGINAVAVVAAPEMNKCAFIVSTGRTGTGFLTRIINDCVPNAWSAHEPIPAFRRRARRLMNRRETVLDVAYFKMTRAKRHRQRDETWYIENNFQLFAAVGVVRKAFPAAKIVHVVRDGRSVIRSYMNRGRYMTSDHITPFDVAGDPARTEWNGWNAVQKNAWFWKTVNAHVRAQHAEVTVLFEDLFNGTTSALEKMLNDIGAPALDVEKAAGLMGRRVNTNRQEEYPPFEEWSNEWQNDFWHIAGDEMAHWGYTR